MSRKHLGSLATWSIALSCFHINLLSSQFWAFSVPPPERSVTLVICPFSVCCSVYQLTGSLFIFHFRFSRGRTWLAQWTTELLKGKSFLCLATSQVMVSLWIGCPWIMFHFLLNQGQYRKWPTPLGLRSPQRPWAGKFHEEETVLLVATDKFLSTAVKQQNWANRDEGKGIHSHRSFSLPLHTQEEGVPGQNVCLGI